MEKLCTIGLLITICLIGLVKILHDKKKCVEINNFTIEYLTAFSEYFQSHGQNIDRYQYVLMNSNKMQYMLGRQGFAAMKPPFANYMYNNYAIIVNGLTDLQSYFSSPYSDDNARQMGQYIFEVLTRKLGDCEQEDEELIKQLKNPISYFSKGIQVVVGIPIYILSMFNILGNANREGAIKSGFFKLISGLVALISFSSALFSLIFGWDQISNLITGIIN